MFALSISCRSFGGKATRTTPKRSGRSGRSAPSFATIIPCQSSLVWFEIEAMVWTRFALSRLQSRALSWWRTGMMNVTRLIRHHLPRYLSGLPAASRSGPLASPAACPGDGIIERRRLVGQVSPIRECVHEPLHLAVTVVENGVWPPHEQRADVDVQAVGDDCESARNLPNAAPETVVRRRLKLGAPDPLGIERSDRLYRAERLGDSDRSAGLADPVFHRHVRVCGEIIMRGLFLVRPQHGQHRKL